MLVSDVFKQLSAAHMQASEANDLRAIADISQRLEGLLCDAPEEPGIIFALATTKLQLGSHGIAINLFKLCTQMRPESSECWNNLGSAWKAQNMEEEARACWEKALSLGESADYYNNLATLYVNAGNPQGGMEYAHKGLALDPKHHRLRWNYSLLLLEQGQWSQGLENYDAGLYSHDRPLRYYDNDHSKIPFWDGQPGCKVVVYGEQGMGDEIMFASCIPDLKRAGIRVVIDCHPRLKDLFERSFRVKCYGTRKSEKITWVHSEKPDYKLAIGSLFGHFRKDGDFPKTPYLKPNKNLVKMYRKRLEALGPGPYVGIGWAAGTVKTRSDYRSLKLAQFVPLMEVGGTFISMQYTHETAAKVERFNEEWPHSVHHWPEVVESNIGGTDTIGYNYDHTVALAEALDLIIVPNTTLVHVCGAIGKECWTVTPPQPAWRYQLAGSDMPMYGPWVTQYRGGFDEITEAYRQWISQSSGTGRPCSPTPTETGSTPTTLSLGSSAPERP